MRITKEHTKKQIVTINVPDLQICFMDYLVNTLKAYKSRSQIARLAIEHQMSEDNQFLRTSRERMEEHE